MNTQTTQQTGVNYADLLYNFAHGRPGFEWANYGSAKYYRQDYRTAYNDLKAFEELHRLAARRCESYSKLSDAIRQHLERSGDRLQISEDGSRLNYITGQYFPTEFRGAACRVLVSVIWNNYREEKNAAGEYVYQDGNKIRKAIREALRSRNAKSWFN